MIDPGSSLRDHVASTHADRLAVLNASAQALNLLGRTAPKHPVPSCPAWTMSDLIHHVGAIYRQVTVLIGERSESGEEVHNRLGPEPCPGEPLFGWFEDRRSELSAVLSATDSREAVWSWAAEKSVAFWARRMAHETLLHLWDAHAALEDGWALPEGLALDGVDEFVTEFVALMRRRSTIRVTRPATYVFLRLSSEASSWTVVLAEPTPTVAFGADPGFTPTGLTRVVGGADQILLALWNRISWATLCTDAQLPAMARWSALVGCP